MHFSRRTPHERQAVRESRRQSVGIVNRTGGLSYFRQSGNGKAPSPEEVANAVRFANGAETAPHTVVRFGPDFSGIKDG
jgi:hypothetical protein